MSLMLPWSQTDEPGTEPRQHVDPTTTLQLSSSGQRTAPRPEEGSLLLLHSSAVQRT